MRHQQVPSKAKTMDAKKLAKMRNYLIGKGYTARTTEAMLQDLARPKNEKVLRKSSKTIQKRRGKKPQGARQKPWWYDDNKNPDGRAMREFDKWENTRKDISDGDSDVVSLNELMSEAAHWGPAVFFDVCMYMFDRGMSIMGNKFGYLPTGVPWEEVTDEGTLRDIKLIGRAEMVIEKVREDHNAYPEDQ